MAPPPETTTRPPSRANAPGTYNLRKQSELARDARGSLEVFGGAPQTSALMFNSNNTDQAELLAAGILQTPYNLRKDVKLGGVVEYPLNSRREVKSSGVVEGTEKKGRENVDRWLASGQQRDEPQEVPLSSSKTSMGEKEVQDARQGMDIPGIYTRSVVNLDGTEPRTSHAGHLEKGNGDATTGEAVSSTELSEEAQAERAKEWGLVLKADGHVQGREERISGLSMRTSEGSDGGSDSVGLPRVSRDLKDVLASFQQTFVVSDATRPDYPILYASGSFFNMTGYTPREVVGRNCRFLQGADTDPEDVRKIRDALSDGKNFCGRLLNYKKDGTPFWNLLTIAPIKDEKGNILKYIGMQVEVSKYTEGLKEKSLRPNGLPESLIKYDARQKDRATSTVQELVGAVKRPQSYARSLYELPVTEGSAEDANVTSLTFDEGGTRSMSRRSTQLVPQENAKARPRSKSESRLSEVPEAVVIGEGGVKVKHRQSGFLSMLGLAPKRQPEASEIDDLDLDGSNIVDEEKPDSLDDERTKDIRRGIDLATTLERIEKNFVITDPRLPDNPIIFASDQFLELTEYSREEILGKNCRFLQGPDTDMEVVKKISEAIKSQRNITVQLLNYTKSGKPFWNLFHLEAMKDSKGQLQYFIGVQLDGSEYLEPHKHRLSEKTEQAGKKIVQATAKNIEGAVQELPDANSRPEDLWGKHSQFVFPRPHMQNSSTWHAMQKVLHSGDALGLNHFRPIKPLGCGDTGSVHLVELRGTDEFFAMKAMDKTVMLNRNKIHRACAEREILGLMDHPFVPTLYGSFQTRTHVCLITDFCPGGELFLLLERQPLKIFREESARFYAAEIVVALEYLHCMGVVYRDLKPENVLVQKDGHVQLTDFDLSFLTTSKPQLIRPAPPPGRKKRHRKVVPPPYFLAEPVGRSNSFVGTEEYIAPEIISGYGHSSSVDWWALGILLYEMLFGRTPFRGRNRQRTFANVLHKDITFPSSIPVTVLARQLIRGLLQRDPTKRLGSEKGANDLKSHPFFKGINWPLIRSMTPPPLETPFFQIGKEIDGDCSKMSLDWDEMEGERDFAEVF